MLKRIVPIAVSLGILGAGLVVSPAHSVQSWHIKSSTASKQAVTVFASSECTGSKYHLYPGDTVSSNGWDSFKANYNFRVLVYDDKTGELLANRNYSAGTCVKAYSNDYLVVVSNLIDT